MTNTTTATIRIRPHLRGAGATIRDFGALTHYDIVADIHETGEVITLGPVRDREAAMTEAGIATDEDFHNDPLAAGWVMAEGTVTR